MRIAKYIDPAVFYDKNSATPYIMSPYLACVNTLSAWPAPHRSHDAVLALENGHAQAESDDEHNEDEIPREEVQHNKGSSVAKPIRYWSFQGFREDDVQGEQNRIANGNAVYGTAREGSIRSQSTKYDEERMVTVENPNHSLALTRLGSHGRAQDMRLSAIAGDSSLGRFPETLSEAQESDEDDDNVSFYTAAEYIFEDEVQPDGSVKPVKKTKKGLTVKKVRKSLHIPSAKTVQKNMRSLSIKRKDKNSKRTDSMGTDVTNESSRKSNDLPTSRKSLDLMKPFRFGHHDKEQLPSSRHSIQVDRPILDKGSQASKSRLSMSEERVPSVRSSNISASGRDTMTSTSMKSGGHDSTSSRQPELFVNHVGRSLERPLGPPTTEQGEFVMARPLRAKVDTALSTPDAAGGSLSAHPARSQTEPEMTMSAVEVQSPASQHMRANIGQSLNSADTITATSDPQQSSRSSAAPEARNTQHASSVLVQENADDTPSSDLKQDDGPFHRLDSELGPWRFSNPKIEPIEDTAFIFGDTSHSVKERRKHFAKSAETRREFAFDPDIVYCMSFFLPYMNFNTFDLKLGPLGANLHKYVNDQPVRYMARSADRPDEVFFMVEFSLE